MEFPVRMTSPIGPKAAARADRATRRSGFTLLELLLVVAIIGLAAGILVPYMSRSIQGLGLQSATRDVIAAARGARAFAILRQHECALVVDPIRGRLEVVDLVAPAADAAAADSATGFADETAAPPAGALSWTNALSALAPDGTTTDAAPIRVVPEFSREIPPPIRIAEVIRDEHSGGEVEGIHWLLFQPNGMCDAFEVRLTDPSGVTSGIRFDPTSAEPEVTHVR